MSALRVLSISTLYPNETAPNFGIFVERQMEAVALRGDVELVLVNPVGLPPWPLSLHPRYRNLRRLAGEEFRKAVSILRPRFRLLPGIGGSFNPGAIVRSVLPLARRLHAARPFDLVDAQFFYPDGPAAAHIAEALRLPFSIKARGADIHHWGRKPGTAQQVLRAGLEANGLLAVSEGIADDMAALGIPRDKITVHRTGLDRDRFRPLDRIASREQLGLPPGQPILATVGALIPRKGQVHAIEALPHLPGAWLVLAGAGPDEAMLRARTEQLGLSSRVVFMGSVPNERLPIVLSATDVFVLPTASEGLANAWVEALACGTPLVTTDIAGARELITDAACGHLVARDGAAIAGAVAEILANPPEREVVARGAAGFSWEENAAQLVAYWRHLAGR